MGRKKNNDNLRTNRQLDRLKWETARELGLEEDLSIGGDELSVREAGKIGGNMTRKLVKKGEEALAEEGDHKANLNLKDES